MEDPLMQPTFPSPCLDLRQEEQALGTELGQAKKERTRTDEEGSTTVTNADALASVDNQAVSLSSSIVI